VGVAYGRVEPDRRRGMKAFGFTLVALLAALALVGAGCGGDEDETDGATATETTDTTTTDTETTGAALKGTVGPGFTITLTTADGDPVETLSAGSYDLEVEDLSSAHNFHLSGPGVDVSTDVAETGTQNFSVDVAAGSYEFVCDPHASQMNGSFEVS
jgi:plastocyanin